MKFSAALATMAAMMVPAVSATPTPITVESTTVVLSDDDELAKDKDVASDTQALYQGPAAPWVVGSETDAACNPDSGAYLLKLSLDISTGNFEDTLQFNIFDACTGGSILDISLEKFNKPAGSTLADIDICFPPFNKYSFSMTSNQPNIVSDTASVKYTWTLADPDAPVSAMTDTVGFLNDGAGQPTTGEILFYDSGNCGGGYTCTTCGDPHMKLWNGDWYDFHGQCDLVMIDAPAIDLLVQIRTTIRYEYSYIETVAVKSGDDILEVGSWGDYFLNGVASASLPAKVGAYSVKYVSEDEREHRYSMELPGGATLELKSFKDMMSVKVLDAKRQFFGDSKGLMGQFAVGTMLGRDGKTLIEDHVEFGQEWQVRADEPKLFQTDRFPQFPATCMMPEPKKESRRLGESVFRAAAEKACSNWPADEVDHCVFDVIATGDLETADAGAY